MGLRFSGNNQTTGFRVVQWLQAPTDKKTEKKLLGKVKKVQKELDKGKTDKAIKELQKFIKEVNKLKKGKKKKIPEEDADMLIEYANNIINSL